MAAIVAALAACGPDAPESPGVLSGARSAKAAIYTPAVQTCPAVPPPAPPGEVTRTSGYRVCGPFRAGAGGSSFECNLPAGRTGPYRLLVTNGSQDGTGRASSASVGVDGVPVLGPQSFDQQVGAATARVALAGTTRIDVAVNGPAGSLQLEVVDEARTCAILGASDVTAAGFQKSFSTANAHPAPELQLLNGGIDGANPTNKGEVSFNGKALVSRIEVREKVTALLRPLELDDANSLSAVAGNRGLFTLRVVDRDSTPPGLSLSATPSAVFTNQPQFRVQGTVDDPSATVTVNGTPAVMDGTTFTGVVTLGECWNEVVVTAQDVCGNATERRFHVALDATAPVVAIQSPPNGLVTKLSSLPVDLRYSDGASGVVPSAVRVTLDGVDVTGSLAVGADAASGLLAVGEGAHSLVLRVTDAAGNEAVAESRFTVDLTPPSATIVAPADGSSGNTSPVAVTVTWSDAISGVNPGSVALSLDGEDVTAALATGPVSASGTFPLAAGTHRLQLSVADLAGNLGTSESIFVVSSGVGLPPDPSTVAPSIDPTVPTDIAAATAFLYSGASPIQMGVSPGTIEARRVAVLRGRVAGRDGEPISGVTVTIVGHPELGRTLTRADGVFDLAVNGGGQITVDYQKDGFLPARRQVRPEWRAYETVEEVVLVPFDQVVNAVILSARDPQVARGSLVVDEQGSRQATLIFPAGTSAALVQSDGTTLPLTTMHVRATEYSVGPSGPKSMPADLPASSAYTYALEVSVDEAVMAGAQGVQLDRPVAFYVENYRGFPVGGIVPVGYYDRSRAAWVPSDNGRVIAVVGAAAGLALLDTNGDGLADDPARLAALGITDEERARLAAVYASGTTLWRVPLSHFSTIDCNWPAGCEANADGSAACGPPAMPRPRETGPTTCPATTAGSIIECQNQVLGEESPVVGTPFKLSYRSDRVEGRTADSVIEVPLSGEAVRSNLRRIILEVSVAGRSFVTSFRPEPNQKYSFVWDGRDAYGRKLMGTQRAHVEVGYAFPAVYLAPAERDRSFAAFSRQGVRLSGSPTEIVMWQQWNVDVGSFHWPKDDLGGWSLDVRHAFDPGSGTLLMGTGQVRGGKAFGNIIKTVAGGGTQSGSNGLLATQLGLSTVTGLTFGEDGSFFVVDWGYSRIWKVDPNGVATKITKATTAGDGCSSANPEGAPANTVCVYPMDIAYCPDGGLYVAATWQAKVWRIDRDGTIRTFAGGGAASPGDGGPATAAKLGFVSSVACGPDGAVHILEGSRLRRVEVDGTISTIAGQGTSLVDGVPASMTKVVGGGNYGQVSVGPDGSIYMRHPISSRIRRIGSDGIVRAAVGNGSTGFGGDGGAAIQAKVFWPTFASLSRDGSLLVADTYNNVIREVAPDGIINTVAGLPLSGTIINSFEGDGGPAVLAKLGGPWKAARGPDGNIYIADTHHRVIRRVEQAFPHGSLYVPSTDGKEMYEFDVNGRHLRTLDATTGAVRLQFEYSDGHLVGVQDGDGDVTRIQRDASGKPVAIVAPRGQVTRLAVGADGMLREITNPNGESMELTYFPGGLLRTLTDPRRQEHRFEHDAFGRLTSDAGPDGRFKTLERSEGPGSFAVEVKTALGRSTSYSVERLSTGVERRVTTDPDGTQRAEERSTGGAVSSTSADGTIRTS